MPSLPMPVLPLPFLTQTACILLLFLPLPLPLPSLPLPEVAEGRKKEQILDGGSSGDSAMVLARWVVVRH